MTIYNSNPEVGGSNSARSENNTSTAGTNRRLSDRLVALRYRLLPDHIIGEVLSKNWIDNAAPFLFLVLTVGIFGTLIDDFFAIGSLSETLRLHGEFGLLVLGMMIVMIGGGIDLSVGSSFALANFVALACMNLLGLPISVTVLIVVATTSMVGLANGLLIGYLKLRAFLTTLVTLIVVRAVVDMLLLKYSVSISSVFVDNDLWYFIGEGSIYGVPVSMLILLVIAVAIHLFLSRMRVGWRIMSVGGSRRSAHNMGINVPAMVCLTYVISGALAGLAGFLYATRLSSAGADTGIGLEIAVLTAAILGGNSLGGGRGSAIKAIMGAVTVLVITTGVIRLGLQSGAGQVVLGAILILAVVVDVRWMKNRDKLLNSTYISPTFFEMPDAPSDDSTPYAMNDRLRHTKLIGLDEVEGPEDVIFDENDHLYCGNRHGDLVRFLAPDYKKHEVFCHIGGHPLGMSFAENGDLYVCVGGMGLYAVNGDGEVRKLTDETNRTLFSIIDDSRLRLADDLDIAPDGQVYFSEATIRHEMHSWPVDALESRGNGRIIRYDPKTNKTETILRNLVFPNGICLQHDGQAILFAESWACRISRHWISGPKAGQTETVIEALPGYPDNINRASDGTYWLALMGMRTPALDVALKMPSFRRSMAKRLPHDEWLYPNINTGCVVKFNDSGNILDVLWDDGGENHPMITSMREHKGHLYLGGIYNNRIGQVKLENADFDWTAAKSYWGQAS